MELDARCREAREAHRLSHETDALASRYRTRRNELVLALRGDRWTYAAIAAATGITTELVAAICQGRTGTTRGR